MSGPVSDILRPSLLMGWIPSLYLALLSQHISLTCPNLSFLNYYLPFKITCPYSLHGNFCYFLSPTLDARYFSILGGFKNNAFIFNKSIPKKYGAFLQQFKVLKRLLIIFSKLKQTVVYI